MSGAGVSALSRKRTGIRNGRCPACPPNRRSNGQANNAPVTIVEFGGFQCYYCRRVNDVLHRVVDAYPGKVRLVYKDFPIAGHDAGRQAAVAARCAATSSRVPCLAKSQVIDVLFVPSRSLVSE